jgi:hypothetical protein
LRIIRGRVTDLRHLTYTSERERADVQQVDERLDVSAGESEEHQTTKIQFAGTTSVRSAHRSNTATTITTATLLIRGPKRLLTEAADDCVDQVVLLFSISQKRAVLGGERLLVHALVVPD